MSIRHRLWLSYLGLVMLLLGLTISSYSRFNRIQNANNIQQQLHLMSFHYSEIIVQLELSISGVGQGKDLIRIEKRIKELESRQHKIIRSLQPQLDADSYKKLVNAQKNSLLIQKKLKKLMAMLLKGETGEYEFGGALLREIDLTIQGQLKTLKPLAQIAQISAEQINNELKITFVFTLGALISVTIIALIMAIWVPKKIGKPIQDLVEQTKKVASGELTAPLNLPKDHTELTQLGQSFLTMRSALLVYRNQMEEQVKARTQELVKTNEALQSEIKTRQLAQQEKESIYRDLIEQSRLAGMAEVATSMLHNVGNLLNSVDVSSGLVLRTIKESKVQNFEHLAKLIEENQNHLGKWFEESEKGKQTASYIVMLSKALNQELLHNQKEMEWLKKNLSHIREIISLQQSYAKVSSVQQIILPENLMNHTIQIVEGTALKLEAKITTEIKFQSEVKLVPQKVLQILVNLLVNALDAIKHLPPGEGHLIFSVNSDSNDILHFSVKDNGIGIHPDDMARLFTFGFTTKEKGHGVGLHSAALAARDMQGNLSAKSDGRGMGTTFILEIPLILSQ